MTLRDQLLELQEPKYMKFTAALMPGVENVLGIRLPVLRKIARQIAAGEKPSKQAREQWSHRIPLFT